MLRFTGPGKIREILLPGVPATTFAASLYNFDIDGDTLKPQHRAWLTEHVVPQLGDPQVQIILQGEASRSGNETHNVTLSRRRVERVASFLQVNGPVLASVSSTGDGSADAAALGEEAKTEDEHFRAVLVVVEHSLPRLAPVVFRPVGSFGPVPSGPPLGFDLEADPPWLMLPIGSLARIMEVHNGQGLTLVSSNPGVASPLPALSGLPTPVKITQQIQKFRVWGRVAGDAEIRAVDAAGQIHGRLAVSVLFRLTVKCAFHYVQNPRYGTQTRHSGDETVFLARLNDIWAPQANIAFEQIPGNAGDRLNLTMTEALGDSIDTQAKFDAVTRHRDPSAQFNIFFVREVEQNPNLGDSADALTELGPPGSCVFEDGVEGDVGQPVSHEAGHCLTLDHNNPIPTTSRMLMNQFATEIFLPRVHVLQARRAVRR